MQEYLGNSLYVVPVFLRLYPGSPNLYVSVDSERHQFGIISIPIAVVTRALPQACIVNRHTGFCGQVFGDRGASDTAL